MKDVRDREEERENGTNGDDRKSTTPRLLLELDLC